MRRAQTRIVQRLQHTPLDALSASKTADSASSIIQRQQYDQRSAYQTYYQRRLQEYRKMQAEYNRKIHYFNQLRNALTNRQLAAAMTSSRRKINRPIIAKGGSGTVKGARQRTKPTTKPKVTRTTVIRKAPIVARQRKALPKTVSEGAPIKKSYNGILQDCCQSKRMPAGCNKFCNFDHWTRQNFLDNYATQQCPKSARPALMQCATSNADHTACCKEMGLDKFSGGRCMGYCNIANGIPKASAYMVPCLRILEQLKFCYKRHMFYSQKG